MISFRAFWVVALLSNMAAAAQWVAIGWSLGDTRLPAAILFLGQAARAVGSLSGALAGVRVIRRLGYRRTLVVSSTLEAVACLVIGAVAYSPDGTLSTGQATAVATVNLLGPFAIGLGGPAWVSLVAEWPGTADRTRQLLLDSIQFQAGRTLGPLVGAAILAVTVHAVQWASLANAATFAMVVACMSVKGRSASDGAVEPAAPKLGPRGDLLADRALWGVTAIAASADAGRVYLPRLVRAAGGSQLTYSVIQSLLAAAAIAAAAVATRVKAADRVVAATGLVALATGLASWGVAGSAGAVAWLTGAVLVGVGVALASAALTSLMIVAAGPARAAAAVATVNVTRTVVGTATGAALATVVGAVGPIVYLPFATLALVTGLALRGGEPRVEAVPPG